MATKDRLIGADASLEKATFGTEVVTGAATAGTWYYITKKDGATVFPAGYEIGDIILGVGTMTFTATNAAKPVTFTTVNDCKSFEFSISADEVETTVLIDGVKKYRKGKADMSGTVTGINMISEMRKVGSILNKFLRTVSGEKDGAPQVLSPVDITGLYIRGLLQDDITTVGETHAFIFGEVELFGYNLGADLGSAQEWSSGIRFIGNDPIVYFEDNVA